MTLDFIARSKNGFCIKLNKDFYTMSAIGAVKKENPGAVRSIESRDDHYVVELDADSRNECFDFLNCLLYHSRVSR